MQKQIIIVLGAGESGVGSAILAQKQGYDVFVSDGGAINDEYKKTLKNYSINFETGEHKLLYEYTPVMVIKSPGIPDKADAVKFFAKKNIPVISEIEFAGKFTSAKMICITGSNGKTTTTLLTYHLLKTAGYNVGLAGNVGMSLARQVAENPCEYYVLELSSFQLDGMFDFKADIAILLNITPDHLDRYEYKFENYVASKFRVIQNQTENDAFIFCKDDTAISSWMKDHKMDATLYPISLKENASATANEQELKFDIAEKKENISTSVLTIQGKHNLYNSMAAGAAALLVGLTKSQIEEGFTTFKNAEHRLEKVATIAGVVYINDSKATNVDSVWYALDCMTQPVIWIVGGVDKGNDYSVLESFVNKKVKGIITLGKDNSILQQLYADKGKLFYSTNNISDAVLKAKEWGVSGDAVLLSPACASFDLFKNYIDRGNQFKHLVNQLVTNSN
ncbi:MAG: UDP-N-acetylmuramoyl-L-alanine--D-glutamate ligase [Bacteroidetes bacterium]|nr:UDP-N-acetylmuramoyl-L-alanine--D-glutamate ligase [Bacteroidota bacterium]